MPNKTSDRGKEDSCFTGIPMNLPSALIPLFGRWLYAGERYLILPILLNFTVI
ncbi:MAG: hypothetical protein ACR9NN_09465 [Nostochopsis sp.]